MCSELWLLVPPHRKHVTTLPCKIQAIETFLQLVQQCSSHKRDTFSSENLCSIFSMTFSRSILLVNNDSLIYKCDVSNAYSSHAKLCSLYIRNEEGSLQAHTKLNTKLKMVMQKKQYVNI